MGITVEFIVGCIGVLIAGATTMELATSKVFKLRAEQGVWRCAPSLCCRPAEAA
jgi:hypothetical protein